ncbi:MAG: CRISPR-associated endonuclease Cas3'', partial [Muribaculaceae bacterium]|nr:CRISPR-associated endonuclease Cas3'' [Muribaculaceae bacterium]
MEKLIAHILSTPSSINIQCLDDHAHGVAELASHFAGEFGMTDWGETLGLLHDKGKERNDFQNYIRKENGIDAPSYGDKAHAWIGAKLAKTLMPKLYPMVTFPILGHHAGMCDYTRLEEHMNKEIPSEVDCDMQFIAPSMDFFKKHNLFAAERQKYIHHVERMLFSCLVDADYLDTEKFMQPSKSEMRKNSTSLSDLTPKLEAYLANFKADSQVNIIRKQIQDCCRKSACKPCGVYSLTVPTGGGKTLSSLLWAMLHAISNNKRRIIIAIPYTSIISQTAAILKGILGEEMVLEHHSNYDYHDNEDRYKDFNPERMASENWDAPIIVTTNVQLFESMYASRPGRCRKLHNVVNSVIILDEVQTLPGEHLQAIVDALKAYNELFGVSLLFTTASQPTLDGKRKGHEQELIGFDKIEEL